MQIDAVVAGDALQDPPVGVPRPFGRGTEGHGLRSVPVAPVGPLGFDEAVSSGGSKSPAGPGSVSRCVPSGPRTMTTPLSMASISVAGMARWRIQVRPASSVQMRWVP